MTSKAANLDLGQRVAADVLQYSSDRFDLGEDLHHLDGVWRVRAPEATIFYAARILEALTADALESAGLSAGSNVLSNLILLQQFNLIPTTTRYWAHALRRSGNSVRHIRERVCTADAELALEFVGRILKWFFCDLQTRTMLPGITRDGGPIWTDGSRKLHALMESFDDVRFDPTAAAAQLNDERESALLRTPALPAVLAEMLLDREEFDAAKNVLDRVLQVFGDDQRLHQLMGLLGSLTGDLPMALEHLEPLYQRSSDDGETAGITAGIYKRLWKKERTNLDWLRKSHGAYRHGWEQSHLGNAYLGINTATTALWLGRPSESRATANEVRELLRRRIAALNVRLKLKLDYWDRVSLAEAELLCGNLSAARNVYQDAFNPPTSDVIRPEVTRAQLGEILSCLDLSASADEFLARPSSPANRPKMVVGVIGHRRLPDDESLLNQARQALERIAGMHSGGPKRQLVVLSALAEGADRLLAELALSAEFAAALTVVLPLEVSDYCRDFQSDVSIADFRTLLNQADSIVFPLSVIPATRARDGRPGKQIESTQDRRNAAYDWAGRYVVDHCDVVLAIWDGKSPGAVGGTAEIVKYAREVGRSLILVHALPPYAIATERLP
jgi:tetratricopeptide (TPR) repeat protein